MPKNVHKILKLNKELLKKPKKLRLYLKEMDLFVLFVQKMLEIAKKNPMFMVVVWEETI